MYVGDFQQSISLTNRSNWQIVRCWSRARRVTDYGFFRRHLGENGAGCSAGDVCTTFDFTKLKVPICSAVSLTLMFVCHAWLGKKTSYRVGHKWLECSNLALWFIVFSTCLHYFAPRIAAHTYYSLAFLFLVVITLRLIVLRLLNIVSC